MNVIQLRILLFACISYVMEKDHTSLATSSTPGLIKIVTYESTNNETISPYVPERLLDSAWSDVASFTACARRSTHEFPTSRGFLYSQTSGFCTPLLWLQGLNAPGAQPMTKTDEEMYWSFFCDNGFEIYEYGTDGSLACLRFSPALTDYWSATATCNSWGGYLVSLKSVEKWELVAGIIDGAGSWVGLDDLEEESVFRYQEDGQEISADLLPSLFQAGEPLDAGGEDCVHMRTLDARLNDLGCHHGYPFVCER